MCKLFEDKRASDEDLEEANEDDLSCSIHVNQFRFRSTDNVTSTGPFYFDNGSVSGDEMLRQMKEAVLGFELAGALIVGVAMDGGGENIRGIKLAGTPWFPSAPHSPRRRDLCGASSKGLPLFQARDILASAQDPLRSAPVTQALVSDIQRRAPGPRPQKVAP